jgi:hypothetical protein
MVATDQNAGDFCASMNAVEERSSLIETLGNELYDELAARAVCILHRRIVEL